jgi:hypothetical protein
MTPTFPAKETKRRKYKKERGHWLQTKEGTQKIKLH